MSNIVANNVFIAYICEAFVKIGLVAFLALSMIAAILDLRQMAAITKIIQKSP